MNQRFLANQQTKAQKAYGRFMAKHGGFIHKFIGGGPKPGPLETPENFFDFNNPGFGNLPDQGASPESTDWSIPPWGSTPSETPSYINPASPYAQDISKGGKGAPYTMDSTGYEPPSSSKSPSKFGEYASLAGTLAPALYNLGRGIFDKSEKLNPKDYMNREINPDLIPENTGQNEIRDAYSRGYYDLKNSGAYSKLGQTALMGSRAKNDYERKLQLATQNTGIKNNNSQFNSSIRDKNNQVKLGIRDINDRNSEARKMMLAKGVNDIGSVAGQFYQNKQMDKRYNEYFDIMDQVYGQTIPGYKSPRKSNTKGK